MLESIHIARHFIIRGRLSKQSPQQIFLGIEACRIDDPQIQRPLLVARSGYYCPLLAVLLDCILWIEFHVGADPRDQDSVDSAISQANQLSTGTLPRICSQVRRDVGRLFKSTWDERAIYKH